MNTFSPLTWIFPLLLATSSFGQTNFFRPDIVGQTPNPLMTNVNQPLTIELTHLNVVDWDAQPVYPEGFTLDVGTGRNYDVNGTTVTPDRNFVGRLEVEVRVDDGRHKSRKYQLRVQVVRPTNAAPIISGQEQLSIFQGESLPIELTQLTVTDSDNNYPADFSLRVFNGPNYRVNQNTITPDVNFTGTLKVPVTVNDGQNESNRYELTIEVSKPQNIPPLITGHDAFKIKEDESITLSLTNLKVTDPDSSFPDSFRLILSGGANYTLSGFQVIPKKDFNGKLSIPAKVNDGQNDSPEYLLEIEVEPVNDAPIITGQVALSTAKNTPLQITLSHLSVTDVDNRFPDGFTLTISGGENYSAGGNTINPAPAFVGQLRVTITVNDGKANSADFSLRVDVQAPPNVAPLITGHKNISSITQNSAVELQLSNFNVTDPDDSYPTDFTLKVSEGSNYTVKNNTITPLASVTNGTITVTVRVNDGAADSPPYALKIQVVPISAKPKINGQKELTMLEDSVINISLNHLMVSDADNPKYPAGFTLLLTDDKSGLYTITGTELRPRLNYNGFVEVGVRVSDGVNVSDLFNLTVLVSAVNDPPQVVDLETTALPYEPGSGHVKISETIDLIDVDSDHLSMAEIGFRSQNYRPLNDQLLFTNDTSTIRAIYDPSGILFLIGYATTDEYRTALRSIEYNYQVTFDESGNPSEILSAPRTLYITLNDGQQVGPTSERQITMETKVTLDIPNAFTPNGDMSNDTWRLQATNKDQLDKAVIRVYNKRGLLLYESTGFQKEWDGYYNGQQLPVDTYYYTIDLNLSYMKKSYRGAVAILH